MFLVERIAGMVFTTLGSTAHAGIKILIIRLHCSAVGDFYCLWGIFYFVLRFIACLLGAGA